MFGDGTQSRDFTYIVDVVSATREAAFRDGIEGMIFNIGAGSRMSVREALELIEEFAGGPLDVNYEQMRPGDVKHTSADVTAAGALLGFAPTGSFEDGLRAEFEWLATGERGRPLSPVE